MNIAQISDNLEKLVESFNKDSFIFDLLLAFGTPKATIARLQLSTSDSLTPSQAIIKAPDTVAIKKKLYFKSVQDEDLQALLDTLKTDDKVAKQAPRFILVTNFETLLAYDTKTDESLDIPILDIAQHYDFFLPWAGMEKAQHATENPADVKAAERMAKLYDEIKKDNPTNTKEEVHNLNVFLSRLLFCFFAEDTGIFEKNVFTRSVDSHTQTDGSDLNVYLDRLFVVMNTPQSVRDKDEARLVFTMPAYLNAFPYVNGGLFRNPHTAPVFTRRSRQMLIDSGNLQWQDINPDIFGSMIQAVITPEHRGGLGMHYTSVPNIMKVIEPLFLDELYEEFAAATGNPKKLNALLQRLWKIKIFDPACGSGNFLIIAYKELRKLEMLIFKELGTFAFSEINLGNFYGIELDDFAHEVATLSLWLAEHQMNQEFMREFGRVKSALPLQETGNIVQGNACRIDWETVCPKNEGDEIYILGNPPYLGSRNQNELQKEDMKITFKNDYKSLDYISCWFIKGAEFILGYNAQCAFVSTNSICQGEQVALLWSRILENKIEIGFAHQSFKWENNAKKNAAVIVIIVGIRNVSLKEKRIYNGSIYLVTSKISPYLTGGNSVFINRMSSPISNLPPLVYGSMPNDGGNLILSTQEKDDLLNRNPETEEFIVKFIGAHDFLNGGERWCFYIKDNQLEKALKNEIIYNRLERVKYIRLSSTEKSTRQLGETPHKFYFTAHKETDSIIIPRHSSERREYIPSGFLTNKTIIADSALAIYDALPWHFSIVISKIHMVWVCALAGRIKTDYRYSTALCYNTFPFPPISDKQKKELEQHVYNILGEREKHSEKTLAQLYDPDKMPAGLREAHRQNDLAVERCYRSRPFESDEERLEYLFKLYEQMIEEEKEKGTLFGKPPKSPKKGGLKE